jgi:hypothetical protein
LDARRARACPKSLRERIALKLEERMREIPNPKTSRTRRCIRIASKLTVGELHVRAVETRPDAEETNDMSMYVLVHGSWHAAWCWYKVVPRS